MIETLRALFITTPTNNVDTLVDAWACFGQYEPDRFIFDHQGQACDKIMLSRVAESRADVVFYIGAVSGTGLPSTSTLQAIRADQPFVHICCDAADPPWHARLAQYHTDKCFTRQIGIDGCPTAPVDVVTLAPIDRHGLKPALSPEERDIRCGWAGNTIAEHRRELVTSLRGLITARERNFAADDYSEYLGFLRRCRLVINSSRTGSLRAHHVKARVIEAGMSGCALLESRGSPLSHWMPGDCFFTYGSPAEAAEIIRSLTDDEIDRHARRLQEEVDRRFHPKAIYSQMLEGLV